MRRRPVRVLGAFGATGLIFGAVALAGPASARKAEAKHVLLLSIDGLHQTDLTWYITHHQTSALAKLVGNGVEFTGAQTPVPSDSFPGLVAQVTGGNPSSTGIYYDDSWNHALLDPSAVASNNGKCAGVAPGVEVTYFEAADLQPHKLDAGQGLSGLPGSILSMTSNPATVIDAAKLPVDPTTCQPVYPHNYLRVNTIFEVARNAGLRTAWSDKHPSYEVANGPSGTGVQDLFTPEINSDATASGDWTSDNSLTQQYDTYKVNAVVNEIKGWDHSGTTKVGVPAIFGMNFQTVSTAQKLPLSGGQPGGYLADGVTPGPVLSGALDYINGKVALFVKTIHDEGLDDNTVIILSAKHGQSPDLPAALTRIDDANIISLLNAKWKSENPSFKGDLVAFGIDDDGMLLWLNDRSAEATEFAKDFLLSLSGFGNDINGAKKAFTQSGLVKVFAGDAAAEYFKAQPGDPRVPDVFGIAQYGVVYTGKKGKIAEHGGANPQDRDVALVVSGEPVKHGKVVNGQVETTQIAPTILHLLGLNPNWLQAVQIEHTAVLPVS